MTDIIIKKGSGVPPEASLKEAELALDVIGGDLYSKMQDGSIRRLTGGDGTGAGMVISPTEPADPVDGMQWLDSTTARVWVWDEDKWLEFPAAGGSSAGEIIIDSGEPENPAEGSQWFNSEDGYLYIQYQGQWVAIGGAGGAGGGDDGGPNSSDPYWSSVEMQLRFEDELYPYKDDSHKRLMGGHNDPPLSSLQSANGAMSLELNLDGSGNKGVQATSWYANAFTGSWTAEAWIYPVNSAGTSGTTKRAILSGDTDSSANDSSFKLFQYGGNFQFTVRAPNGDQTVNIVSSGSEVKLNQWQHVAISCDGDQYRFFHNGKLAMAVSAVGADQSPVGFLEVGRTGGTNAKSFSGYMDDVRLTDGVCRYVSDFETPGELPTAGTKNLLMEERSMDNDADLS